MKLELQRIDLATILDNLNELEDSRGLTLGEVHIKQKIEHFIK